MNNKYFGKKMKQKTFRLLIATVIIVFAVMTFGVNCTENSSATYEIGDINCDGNVDMFDRITLSRYLSGWSGVTLSDFSADINNDGKVNSVDRMILSRFLAGWLGYGQYFPSIGTSIDTVILE